MVELLQYEFDAEGITLEKLARIQQCVKDLAKLQEAKRKLQLDASGIVQSKERGLQTAFKAGQSAKEEVRKIVDGASL